MLAAFVTGDVVGACGVACVCFEVSVLLAGPGVFEAAGLGFASVVLRHISPPCSAFSASKSMAVSVLLAYFSQEYSCAGLAGILSHETIVQTSRGVNLSLLAPWLPMRQQPECSSGLPSPRWVFRPEDLRPGACLPQTDRLPQRESRGAGDSFTLSEANVSAICFGLRFNLAPRPSGRHGGCNVAHIFRCETFRLDQGNIRPPEDAVFSP